MLREHLFSSPKFTFVELIVAIPAIKISPLSLLMKVDMTKNDFLIETSKLAFRKQVGVAFHILCTGATFSQACTWDLTVSLICFKKRGNIHIIWIMHHLISCEPDQIHDNYGKNLRKITILFLRMDRCFEWSMTNLTLVPRRISSKASTLKGQFDCVQIILTISHPKKKMLWNF